MGNINDEVEGHQNYHIHLRISHTFDTPKLTPKSSASYMWVILKRKVIFGII